ncbi:MAG: hypothetical protein VX777_08055 [Chlamydiota bacterium]|nr:hypothetical protein [Chlamydiota bacterium]
MSINPERPNIDLGGYQAPESEKKITQKSNEKNTGSTSSTATPEKDKQTDLKLRQRKTLDRTTTESVKQSEKHEETKTTLNDTIKSAAGLNKLHAKPPSTSSQPQLPTPKPYKDSQSLLSDPQLNKAFSATPEDEKFANLRNANQALQDSTYQSFKDKVQENPQKSEQTPQQQEKNGDNSAKQTTAVPGKSAPERLPGGIATPEPEGKDSSTETKTPDQPASMTPQSMTTTEEPLTTQDPTTLQKQQTATEKAPDDKQLQKNSEATTSQQEAKISKSAQKEVLGKLFFPNEQASPEIEKQVDDIIKQTVESLTKTFGTNPADAKKQVNDAKETMQKNLKAGSAGDQKLNFSKMASKNFPGQTKPLTFLYANPEFKSAMPEDLQKNYESLISKASEKTNSKYPEMSKETISRESDSFNYSKPTELRSAFTELVEQSDLPEQDKNILENLFTRPEMASKFPKEKGNALMNTRNNLLKQAGEQVQKGFIGSQISPKNLAKVMQNALKFGELFQKNLQGMQLNKSVEYEAQKLLTTPNKKASPEAKKAFESAKEATLRNADFKSYPQGFTRTTMSEANGFKKAMEQGINSLKNAPDAVKQQLREMISNPDKMKEATSSQEVIKMFNELISNEGMLGVSDSQTDKFSEERKFGDDLRIVNKLRSKLRKAGATTSQANKFIEKFLKGDVSMNHPIVNSSIKEVGYERGLPEEMDIDMEGVKKAFNASNNPKSELVTNASLFLEDITSAVVETAKELEPIQGEGDSSSSTFNLNISTGQFVKLMQNVSIQMVSINQYITIKNTNIQTTVQNAIRASTNAVLQAQANANEDQSKINSIGSKLKDAVTLTIKFVLTPGITTAEIIAGGGIGRGGIQSAIDHSPVIQAVGSVAGKVFQVVGKVIQGVKDLIKLSIIFSPLGMVLFGAGFIEEVQKNGFKDAIDQSLVEDLTGTMETYGIPADSNAMAVIDTVFTAVEAVTVAAIAIAVVAVASVFTGGAALVAIAGMALASAATMIGGALESLAPELEDAGWLSKSQEQMMMKVVGITTMVVAAVGMVVGLGASVVDLVGSATKMAETMKRITNSLKNVGKSLEEAYSGMESIADVPKALKKIANDMMSEIGYDSAGVRRTKGDVEKSISDLSGDLDDIEGLLSNAEYPDTPAGRNAKKANEEAWESISSKFDEIKKDVGNIPEENMNLANLEESSEAMKTANSKLDEISSLLDQINTEALSGESKLNFESAIAKSQKGIEQIGKDVTELSSAITKTMESIQKATKTTAEVEMVSEPSKNKSAAAEASDPPPVDDGSGNAPVDDGSGDAPVDDGSGDSGEAPVDPNASGGANSPVSDPYALSDAQNYSGDMAQKDIQDNIEAMKKGKLKKIKNIGEEATENTAEIEALEDMKSASKKSNMEKFKKAAKYVQLTGQAISGASKMYQGIVQMVEAPLKADIKKQQANIDLAESFIDEEQQTIQVLQDSSQDATQTIEQSVQFFYRVIGGLIQDITGATDALYKK